ncbi:MAG: hypothetical protein CM15mP46_0250 [Alphaproteobacteria bacterium]|nr:MAG: hypothetical protein CM15mP46_0250 [Alphaproteobacteria bacterium]
MMTYDDQNVFAKILRGEIPCTKIDEDDYCLCFADVNPQAPFMCWSPQKGLC